MLLKQNTPLNKANSADLKAIIEQYPYFQAARALYLKSLKTQHSFKYNNALKVTAAYTTDREVLLNYISKFSTKNTVALSENETSVSVTKEEHTTDTPIEKGAPIAFNTSETHSFNQWLQLSSVKKINRTEKPKTFKEKKERLISNFIEKNPKIIPLQKGKDVKAHVLKEDQDTALMTETLAKVYLEQHKYDNAIQAYKILSLKYPEKSGFFADQINRIKKLQKNKL